MEFNLNDFLNEFVRVPAGADVIVPISLTEDYPDPQGLGMMEQAVLHKIESLAANVKIKAPDLAERSYFLKWTKKWEPGLEMQDSFKRIVRLFMLQRVVTIAFIMDGHGPTVEIKSFSSHTDNHELKKEKKVQFTDYIDNTKKYEVHQSDIAQFSRYPDGNWDQPTLIRKEEQEYYLRGLKINKIVGFIEDTHRELSGIYGDSQDEAKALGKLMNRFAENNLTIVPKDHKFTSYNLESIDRKMWRENILSDYCDWYGLPVPLFYKNLPTHTTQTLSNAYAQFIRSVLNPIFEPILSVMGRRFNTEFVLDYSQLQVLSADELMKMSQTGIYTINELRAKAGEQPIPGGDKIPDAAGTTPTDDQQNGDDEEDAKKDVDNDKEDME